MGPPVEVKPQVNYRPRCLLLCSLIRNLEPKPASSALANTDLWRLWQVVNVDGCFKLRSLGGFCYRALDNQCRVPGKSSPKRFWGNTCALLSFLQADGFWSELFPPPLGSRHGYVTRAWTFRVWWLLWLDQRWTCGPSPSKETQFYTFPQTAMTQRPFYAEAFVLIGTEARSYWWLVRRGRRAAWDQSQHWKEELSCRERGGSALRWGTWILYLVALCP